MKKEGQGHADVYIYIPTGERGTRKEIHCACASNFHVPSISLHMCVLAKGEIADVTLKVILFDLLLISLVNLHLN